MSDTGSELDEGDFNLSEDDCYAGVVCSDDDKEDTPPTLELTTPQAEEKPKKRMQLVVQKDHSKIAGSSHAGAWEVGSKPPTGDSPFFEIVLLKSAPLAPQSRTHAEVLCCAMNDSLQLEYLCYRGNILCDCLLSFKPGKLSAGNQKIWNCVREFAELNRDFIIEVVNQQSKLNTGMARLGTTAYRCSDQLESKMDITMAVAPFEDAVVELKNQSIDLFNKNDMLTKQLDRLTGKIQACLAGDVRVKSAAEDLTKSAENYAKARQKYLEVYKELNEAVTKLEGRLVQLNQQLTDMKYTCAMVKKHMEMLDRNTLNAENHFHEMAKIETTVNDYFYEKKVNGKVVKSVKIFREAQAKKNARRSRELQDLMRKDAADCQRTLDKHEAALRALKQEYTSVQSKKKEAKLAMTENLKQHKMKLDNAEGIYESNLKALEEATTATGVGLKNLHFFLKAFRQIHFYNIDVQTTTNKVLDQVQAISSGLDDGLRNYRIWSQPLSRMEEFSGEFKPMIRILAEEGIETCGELAIYHEDKREMNSLLRAMTPKLIERHRNLLIETEDGGFELRPGFKNRFRRACKRMYEAPEYLRKTTMDMGGYMSVSYTAFKRGQKLLKKPTAETLEIELQKKMFLPGKEHLAIKDSEPRGDDDEHKHDYEDVEKPAEKKKGRRNRFVK